MAEDDGPTRRVVLRARAQGRRDQLLHGLRQQFAPDQIYPDESDVAAAGEGDTALPHLAPTLSSATSGAVPAPTGPRRGGGGPLPAADDRDPR